MTTVTLFFSGLNTMLDSAARKKIRERFEFVIAIIIAVSLLLFIVGYLGAFVGAVIDGILH